MCVIVGPKPLCEVSPIFSQFRISAACFSAIMQWHFYLPVSFSEIQIPILTCFYCSNIISTCDTGLRWGFDQLSEPAVEWCLEKLDSLYDTGTVSINRCTWMSFTATHKPSLFDAVFISVPHLACVSLWWRAVVCFWWCSDNELSERSWGWKETVE